MELKFMGSRFHVLEDKVPILKFRVCSFGILLMFWASGFRIYGFRQWCGMIIS